MPTRSAPTKPAAAPVQSPPAVKAAPVVPQTQRELYTVKPGDTLYSIALEHGLDYRELAIWNGIDNPGSLKVGQQLRVVSPASGVVAAPLKTPGGTVQAKPLASPSAATASPPVPLPPPGPAASAAAAPVAGTVVTEPRGVRVPYSDQALAQLATPDSAQPKPETRADTKPETRPETKPETRVETKPPARPEAMPDTPRAAESGDWIWPARGKLLATFNGTTNKGIDIAGKRGQPVLASAPGRVIFSGTGVRGMGKFIVVKHSDELISVYGHNDEVLVKYGQSVTKGQKIAEMGSTDTDQVKLHFEIRRNGTPIDPLTVLPSSA